MIGNPTKPREYAVIINAEGYEVLPENVGALVWVVDVHPIWSDLRMLRLEQPIRCIFKGRVCHPGEPGVASDAILRPIRDGKPEHAEPRIETVEA